MPALNQKRFGHSRRFLLFNFISQLPTMRSFRPSTNTRDTFLYAEERTLWKVDCDTSIFLAASVWSKSLIFSSLKDSNSSRVIIKRPFAHQMGFRSEPFGPELMVRRTCRTDDFRQIDRVSEIEFPNLFLFHRR